MPNGAASARSCAWSELMMPGQFVKLDGEPAKIVRAYTARGRSNGKPIAQRWVELQIVRMGSRPGRIRLPADSPRIERRR